MQSKYFMDTVSLFEINAFIEGKIKALERKNNTSWELMQIQLFKIYQMLGGGDDETTPQDVLNLPWLDVPGEAEESKKIDKEKFKALKKRALEREKQLKKEKEKSNG